MAHFWAGSLRAIHFASPVSRWGLASRAVGVGPRPSLNNFRLGRLWYESPMSYGCDQQGISCFQNFSNAKDAVQEALIAAFLWLQEGASKISRLVDPGCVTAHDGPPRSEIAPAQWALSKGQTGRACKYEKRSTVSPTRRGVSQPLPM